MSPELQQIEQMSHALARLSGQREWQAMVDLAQQRQTLLEHYFALPALPDTPDIIRATLVAIQQSDQQLMAGAKLQRQQLLADAVDLRQRWLSSTSYQSVQDLHP